MAVIDSLDWVHVRIETVRGRMHSKWQREGSTSTLEVEVLVGAEAVATGLCAGSRLHKQSHFPELH